MISEKLTYYANKFPLIPAISAGICIGVAARILKLLIAAISRFATSGFSAFHTNIWFIGLGILAIVLCGLFVRKVVRMPLEHATPRIKADLTSGKTALPLRLTVSPIVASAFTLGFGGSAGAEGPIAYSGAAIASNFARRLHLSPRMLSVFLACGAGAGIAAIFKAPVGGMFFTIEVLRFSLAVPELLLLAAMCLAAALSAFALDDFTPDVTFSAIEGFEPKFYIPAIILGIICGIYSRYYLATGLSTARRLEAISKPWLRNLIAGSILGLLLFLFPALYGEGYQILAQVLNGDLSVVTQGTFAHGLRTIPLTAICFTCILALKGIATYATNSGGGVAGDFAPTIFAGGMLGALFAMGASLIPLWPTLPFGDFTLLAMAGVMAGTVKAPFMAIFLVTEMTAAPQLLLPVALVALISRLTA